MPTQETDITLNFDPFRCVSQKKQLPKTKKTSPKTQDHRIVSCSRIRVESSEEEGCHVTREQPSSPAWKKCLVWGATVKKSPSFTCVAFPSSVYTPSPFDTKMHLESGWECSVWTQRGGRDMEWRQAPPLSVGGTRRDSFIPSM